jgi:hypothetical protein
MVSVVVNFLFKFINKVAMIKWEVVIPALTIKLTLTLI